MFKMLLYLCLTLTMSGVFFTSVSAFAQDEAETSAAQTSSAAAAAAPSEGRTPAAESPAPAASNAGGKKGEKVKNLNFEDELVQGATDKPELFYLFQKKNFNYKRLIKLRENFLPEMRKTSEEVQRVRSQD